ncbi:hypothetical protein TNCV_4727961 [Trichonephila clavipes]|nr:hypothetical protein TNCV_4727961 [Trichonephila clavipes]
MKSLITVPFRLWISKGFMERVSDEGIRLKQSDCDRSEECVDEIDNIQGLYSNTEEGMVLCKCALPVPHGDNQNIRGAASPHVCLMEGEDRWDAPGPSTRMFSLKCRLEGGQTEAEVAQAIGVSQSVISRIWYRFLETGSAGRRPR